MSFFNFGGFGGGGGFPGFGDGNSILIIKI